MTLVAKPLTSAQIAQLDVRFLDEHGGVRLLPASAWADVDTMTRALWCYHHGFYGLPTGELIAFVREVTAGRSAIEIGAGATGLGRYLGIPMTDSAVQCRADMRAFYTLTGQKPTEPGSDVERIDALSAVAKYRPRVVVASWVTRFFRPGVDKEGVAQAFGEGVDEEALFEKVDTYIHIGNEGSHGEKTLLSLPHAIYRAPWLLSRSQNPGANVIYVWGDKGHLEGEIALPKELLHTG